MQFDSQLLQGRLLKRYQRFLADVELADGSIVTAHTANTGSMLGCCTPGARVWLRDSGRPQRKYPLSWELVEAAGEVLVGINTALPNTLVREALEARTIPELRGYRGIRPEVPYGRERSRIDLLLHSGLKPDCYVEVKNVTLAENGIGYFPDAVSERGTRHLRELQGIAEAGGRGVIFFCVQRADVEEVHPADHIDPEYGRALRSAVAAGVEALAWRADVSPAEIVLSHPVPVVCP